MQIARTTGLSIEAQIRDGKVLLHPKGPLAGLAKPVITRINNIFREEKPIANDGVISKERGLVFSTWIPPAPSKAFDRMIMAEINFLLHKRLPDQFSIAVTRACPNNCIHCAAPARNGEILKSSVIEHALDEALELGSYLITFDGGEPMLREDLPALVGRVDDRAIATSFSSGYGLTPELARKLKSAGLFSVRISIDSPFEEEHDRVRGRRGAFADAISGIQNALSSDLLVDMFMVVTPDNIDDIEDAYSLACDLGVHELSFYEIVAIGRWADHIDDVLGKREIDLLTQFHREKNRISEGPRVTALPYLLDKDMFGCFAGRRWIHVEASGNALPCAYMPLSFGNINERSLKEIWHDMARYPWFSGRCSCQMRDPAFREAHNEIIDASR